MYQGNRKEKAHVGVGEGRRSSKGLCTSSSSQPLRKEIGWALHRPEFELYTVVKASDTVV